MENKIVIGLVGDKVAGKGTVSKYLVEKYGAVHYGTSKILTRTLKDLQIPTTRDNLGKLALTLKEKFGPSVIVDSLIAEMENNGSNILIADGIRMPGDTDPFKAKYKGNFKLIYVTADVKIRFERAKKRKEKDGEDTMTFDEFMIEENRPTEISIKEIGKEADFTISNDETEKELFEQIDSVMNNIIKN